ncbi:hypothetical protein L6452_03377 [Arctium lappa]|uniref:Uncharacterized protein n=1 Tax=Arctium lappa TaxID=4217 RepID=A0ACB9FN93_ARCLA|nr:hypothetical protein L6452_03377 [Arctium lappa]
MAAAQGTQEHIVDQMNMELNATRARIVALRNQHMQSVEELESLRNQNASNAAGHSHGQSGLIMPWSGPPLPNHPRPLFPGISSQPMPTLPPPPPSFFPSTAQIPSMPFVTSIPPFFHSTAPILAMPLAASIPSMPMSSFQYNGYVSDSSQRNGFQSSGHVPPVVQGNT